MNENGSKKQFIIWTIVIVGIAGLLYGLSLLGGSTGSNSKPDVTDSGISDHIAGAPDAEVVVIEYSDFQCPACKAREPIVAQLREHYGDTIAFVYRQFPLRSIHRNAQAAAQAAEAAGLQGKFWEMHDKLFENQDSWSNSTRAKSIFEGYAKDLGLDMDKFNDDFDSDDVIGKINKDYKAGQDIGVQGTPSFVINGKLQTASLGSLQAFRDVIDPLLGDAAPSISESIQLKDATGSDAN